MVVVDGQQAREQRIETQQEQAARGSSKTGEPAGAVGTSKQNKTSILSKIILSITLSQQQNFIGGINMT